MPSDSEQPASVLPDASTPDQREMTRQENQAGNANVETPAPEATFALLDALFATAPIGLGFFDRELRYQRINAALAEINGLDVADHLGKTLAEVLPNLSSGVAEDLQHVLRDGVPIVNREVHGQTPAAPGALRTWLASYYPVWSTERAILGVGAVVSETTEQKRAEAEQHKFAALVQNSTDVIGIASLEGQVQFLNASAQRLLGVESQSDVAALTIADCIAPEQRVQMQDHILPGVMHHGAWVGELMLCNYRTKETLPVFANIFLLIDSPTKKPTGFACVARDIREQKRIENWLRLLAEASAELGSSFDYETTLTNFARLAVQQFAHWCMVTVLDDQTHQLAVAHKDPEREQWLEAQLANWPATTNYPVAKVLETGRSVFLPDLSGASAELSGETYQRLSSFGCTALISVPLQVRERLFGTITFATTGNQHYMQGDVRLAEELANRAALAVENARLYREAQAAVGVREQFLSVASHELKTPLTAVLGNLQLLQRRVRRENLLSERDQRTLQVAVDQTLRLSYLISTLLDISRLQSDQLQIEQQLVQIDTLVERLVADTQLTLEQHTLVTSLPNEQLLVLGDPVRLEQVLQNLIQNAVKYSPGGGAVEIVIRRDDVNAVIDVRDHGIGIPREALPHLFNRFYRAPNVQAENVSGIGLGLFVVREIVTLHGGKVSVSSSPDMGSTFTLTLPLASK